MVELEFVQNLKYLGTNGKAFNGLPCLLHSFELSTPKYRFLILMGSREGCEYLMKGLTN